MPTLYFHKTAITVTLRVPEALLAERLPASPAVVAGELARQVQTYVQKNKLGYYPALDFLEEQQAIDQDVLDAAQGIAWYVAELVNADLIKRFRTAFSNVDIQGIQSLAYTMPATRTTNPNALHELTEHYTPNVVKVVMVVTNIERQAQIDGSERLAAHKVSRWLGRQFEDVEVTSAVALPAERAAERD